MMVWKNKKVKIGWGLFCLTVILVVTLLGMRQPDFTWEQLGGLIPIALLGLLALLPSKQQAKAGITKETLKAEFGIADIVSEKGTIAEDKIINGNLEYALLETDGGYTNKTIRNMIKKHEQGVRGKSIVIRMEQPNINRGTAFSNYGLYVETGRQLKDV